MMRGFCAMWLALVVLPGTARAQSAGQNAAWNGYYLGVNVGGRFASNDWLTSLACPNSGICAGGQVGPDFKQGFDSSAVRVGAFGGRNWTLGSGFVAGVEADIGWANNRNANGPIPGTTASGGPTALPSISNGDTAAVNLQWDASLRARVGTLIRPDTLLFATAGVALQQVETIATCRNDASGATYCTQPPGQWHYDSQTRWMPGWTIGAGLEHMLADRWLLRLEYRYADFGQANPTFFANNISDNGDDRVYAHVWVKTHTLSLGAAYKF